MLVARGVRPGADDGVNQVNIIQLNLPDWPYGSTGFYYLWDPTAALSPDAGGEVNGVLATY